jgi:RsiW-degrading membrane proteinase PrsW (M82 family)
MAPFVVFAMTDHSPDPMGTGAWAFAAIAAVACGLLAWKLVRPDSTEPALMAQVAGATAALTAFHIVAEVERGLGVGAGELSYAGAIFQVGLVEELAKALPVFVFLYVIGKGRHSPRTFMFMGALSGIAFGAVEAVHYMTRLSNEPNAIAQQTGQLVNFSSYANSIVGRVFFGPMLHMVWAGIAAYFIGLAAHHPALRAKLIGLGLGSVIVAHGLYDATNSWTQTVIACVSIATFAGYALFGNRLEDTTTTTEAEPVPNTVAEGSRSVDLAAG